MPIFVAIIYFGRKILKDLKELFERNFKELNEAQKEFMLSFSWNFMIFFLRFWKNVAIKNYDLE